MLDASGFPARWKTCESLQRDYTDSGRPAQNLGETGLGLGHVERLAVARIRHGRARSGPARRPASGGTTAATLSVSARSPLHGSTRSEPAASTAAARSAMLPVSAFMPRSSLISRPSKPMAPRITSSVTRLRGAGRRIAHRGREHHVRGHRRRQVGQRAERREVGRLQLAARRRDDGQVEVAVVGGAAVPRDVLDDRQHAAGHASPPPPPRPARPPASGRRAVGAVADDVVAARRGHVEHRRAVGVDAERRADRPPSGARPAAPIAAPPRAIALRRARP